MSARDELKAAKRIVVKVGTSTITHETGRMDYGRMEKLVREIADLRNAGREMVLVTSGAIAAGLDHLGRKERPTGIPERQAVAAIGQCALMHIYDKLFAEYGQVAGQVLLTKDNYLHHHQYSNSRNALRALLQMGAVPVINENDAVSVDEVKIGDNDTLSAMVANLVDADALIILSDIDGVYTANPQTDANARLLSEIREITPEIEQLAGGAGSKMGTGGMMTKIEAAKIARSSGTVMVIAPGAREHVLHDCLSGAPVGTLFPAKEAHLAARKSWLAFGKNLAGDIVVDAGCERALVERGASILAAGIVEIAGDFAAGSTVRVLSAAQQEIARGIVNYDAASLAKIIGRQTKDFASLLGEEELREEVIHRDNMVLMV